MSKIEDIKIRDITIDDIEQTCIHSSSCECCMFYNKEKEKCCSLNEIITNVNLDKKITIKRYKE